MREGWFVATVICGCLTVCAPLFAAEEAPEVKSAQQAEAEAREHFRAGRFEQAARQFASAYRRDPRANTKYNEALAWRKAGEPARAADAYAAALSLDGLDEELARKGSDSLSALKERLGRILVRGPVGARVSVAHVEQEALPTHVYLAPAQHRVVVTYGDGSRETRDVALEVGEELALSFTDPASDRSSDRSGDRSGEVVAPPVEARSKGPSATSVAGWTFLGLGAAGLVAMGVTGSLTLNKVAKYDDTGNTDVALYDEAVTLKTTTNALLGAGLGLASLGLVLVLIPSPEGDDATARLRLGSSAGAPLSAEVAVSW